MSSTSSRSHETSSSRISSLRGLPASASSACAQSPQTIDSQCADAQTDGPPYAHFQAGIAATTLRSSLANLAPTVETTLYAPEARTTTTFLDCAKRTKLSNSREWQTTGTCQGSAYGIEASSHDPNLGQLSHCDMSTPCA